MTFVSVDRYWDEDNILRYEATDEDGNVSVSEDGIIWTSHCDDPFGKVIENDETAKA